ncbi:MAG TPA: TolC family protein, partial [Spirochaetia bacterium]|nr:TolC family protein [Spirochaetia bacterium]
MKKKPWTSALLPALMALLLFPAAGASAEETVPAPREIVTLDQVISAARSGAPGLKLAGITADTARSQLTQVQATNGLALGAKAGYFHQGNLPGTAAAASASGSGLNGENIQGGVTLSGPTSVGLTAPATSVGLTAQHTIPDSAASGPASSLNLSASQTVFDGYPGGRAAAAVQQATSTYRAAQVAYDASMKSTLYQVKQAYYALLGDQNTVLIRQAAVGQAEQNLAYYQGLLTAQRATQLDVLQNQVALTQAQLDLRAAQNTVDVDRRNLSLDI